jgi:DMSO/TMAO reductase YedYZ heme-binding membrane subunit
MGLVTFLAFINRHIRRMWFVTLGAHGDLSMNVVAGGTIERGMFALVFLQLRDLLGVTRKARVSDIARKGNFARRMGILVAAHTALKFKMGFPHMTLVTLGDIVLLRRPVAWMAACTTDSLMFSSAGSYVRGGAGMTLRAIIV